MDEKSEGITLLFHKLCELSFLHEAAKREDAYTRIRYTKARRLKFQTVLYEKLFDELQAPWSVSEEKKDDNTSLNPYEKIAVTIFQLRLARKFDRADLLEYCTSKWRAILGISTDSVDIKSPRDYISEPDAILRFVEALSGTGPLQPLPALGHQDELLANNMQYKDFKSHLPDGPLLNTDSLKLKTEALLAEHYVQYSSALFERLPTIGQDILNQTTSLQMFSQVTGPGQGRNRFFALQEAGEAPHDKETRTTVFGALSHGYTEDMQVKLGLPELPLSPHQKTFGISTLPTAQSPDDEGFHELTESSITSSRVSSFSTSQQTSGEDIWKAALELPPQNFYTWEMEGRRDGLTEFPYISEAGPAVFDELYNLVSRQLSYLVKTPSHYTMVSLTTLVSHSLDVLIGVPSATYHVNTESLGFTVNPDVRLSGCSPELIQNVLSKLAVIGTDYVRLDRFIHRESHSRGLVLQAFLGGLRNYLQCYRATVLSVNVSTVNSPFQLSFTFQSLGKQLRFLSNMCMCSKTTRPPTSPKQAFPAGVKLLSYLYKLATDYSSSEHYPVLLSLLKHSCTPYITFVQQWVFQGKCIDLYGEFIIELDDQFLAYRDKHFWSHGFVIAEKDKLECVPLFLSELANDIFVCGKSINLLKLCCPDHFLCDSGVLPPKMEVTFSMSKLKAIDQNCLVYIDSMEAIAKNINERREKKKLALAEAKEEALLEEKQRAEKALADIDEMIEKVKEAISVKKKEDLQMLKQQMEDAIKQKEDKKEKEMVEDRKFMEEAMHRFDEADGVRERARQELIEYYQKLTEEMDRREERAQWTIKRHELNKTRIEFFAREEAQLEQMIKETSEKESENFSSTKGRSKQDVYTTVRSTDSLANTKAKHTERITASTPSPSLVSLITSGVKTDALVQSRESKSVNKYIDDTSDSGFIPGSKVTDTALPGSRVMNDDDDDDDDHTLKSVPPLEHDDYDETDTSEASSSISAPSGVSGRGRKQWSSSKGITSIDVKAESSTMTSRRTWDPTTGVVHLAESPFPHGHPSESSIQFAMYGDKKSDGANADASLNIKSSPNVLPAAPNPSDSSLQSTLYPESSQGVATPTNTASVIADSTEDEEGEKTAELPELSTPSKDIDPVIQDFLRSLSTDVTKSPSVRHPFNTAFQKHMNEEQKGLDMKRAISPFGHPTQSTAQDILYPIEGAADKLRERSQFGHPADSSAQNVLYITQETPSTHGTPKSIYGHPTDSSAQNLLYITQETQSTHGTPKSIYGHPTDSSAQNLLYITQETQSTHGTPKSIYGHPTDSSAQNLLYITQETQSTHGTPKSIYGHPTDSSAQNLLYITQETQSTHGTPKSIYGHPTDSSAQNLLYITQETQSTHGTPKSIYGHPTDSSAQNLLYAQQDSLTPYGAPKSVHGHPTDSTAQEVLYRGNDIVAPSHVHRSAYGHPSDSQLVDNSSVSSRNILAHTSRGHWGHPSDSKVQRLLGDISTLSDIGQHGTRGTQPASVVQDILYPETTRGAPPPDSAKSVLYPGEGAGISGGTRTRGHEPAVTITKLMYPKEQEKEIEPEPAKPLQFEDIWVASLVQPLQDNFDILDQHPTTDLLKSALGPLMLDQDDDDDIDAARLMSLPVLMRRSVTAPLTAQISLVNSAVVKYFMEELELQQQFEVFRKFLFMEDGEFSLSLSDQMFERLSTGVTPREFCSPTVMNGIVTRALQLSVFADKTGYEQQLSFALKSMPDMFNLNDIGTLDFLELRYHVQWPVNVVITENSIIKYNKVFSFMLRLKRVAWVLREIWFHLKHIGFSRRAAGSPQLRQLQLFRHEMLHFLQNIDGYLSNQILNVTWVEFQQELATNVRNLDDLHRRHTEYLNKAIFRSLLSKKAAPVMKIINDIFSLVLKFRTQLMSCPWQQDSAGGHVVHPRFDVMCATHRAFKEYSGFLFTVVSKLVRRGYQSHLQDFLLRLNFNDFYKMV